jgi:hypothetical protein
MQQLFNISAGFRIFDDAGSGADEVLRFHSAFLPFDCAVTIASDFFGIGSCRQEVKGVSWCSLFGFIY